jgi:hypothetical protein
VGWKKAVWRWVWLGFWLRRRREMLVGTRSGIVDASVIMAGSAQAARRNAGEPCRVMARWSRSGRWHAAVRGAGASVRRSR